MFNDTQQSFGCTALLLQGGVTFGMYHIGVVKSLFERGLLPRIISGTSVGALIAALVCIHTDVELPGYFRLEAYLRTGRILNIPVAAYRKGEIPQLLNYLTAPKVLIRSAACSCVGLVGLYQTRDLLAKSKDGSIFTWCPSATNGAHVANPIVENPEKRLAELFNVNHFIVSQASPLHFSIYYGEHMSLISNRLMIEIALDKATSKAAVDSQGQGSVNDISIRRDSTRRHANHNAEAAKKPSKPHAQRKPRIPSASLSTGDALAKSSSVAPASVSQGSAKRKREVVEPNIETQTLSINDEADLDALEDANVSASDPSPVPRGRRLPTTLADCGVEFINHYNAAYMDRPGPSQYTSLIAHVLAEKTQQLTTPKPSLRLLIVCSSAERTLEIIKGFKATLLNVRILKLFARHIKLPEQVGLVNTKAFPIGVGTPHRIAKLLMDDSAQPGLSKLQHIVFDQSYMDSKKLQLFDSAEKELAEILTVSTHSKWTLHGV
ncbi:hypothetical protein BSLG_004152 [Batrachochytrium salamandrivorans]|nr:hypothetical protein BSLG_004152 [Batrachochytrium salamandrivorans]